jgi:hypothetical protein
LAVERLKTMNPKVDPPGPKPRRQSQARRVARENYPYACCCICGLKLATALDLAHLDHDAGNNEPDNLAWLCKTHHWMYDAGLYPREAVKMLRAHWQATRGKPDHSARMKDAGRKAAETRNRRKAAETRKRSRAARKAWETRRADPSS